MKRRSIVLASVCLVGLFLPVVTRLLEGNGHAAAWLIDLASHWQWVFLVGLMLSSIVVVCGGRHWAVLFLAAPLPWLTASAQAPVTVPGKPQLKVAAANVGLATRVMQDTLNSMPIVMDEPEPRVFFMGFGESSLDFKLFVFSRELGDRLPLMHAVHQEILEALRHNGIEIPFPQRDLHVRSVDGEAEFRVSDGQPGQD